jgi:hypothetical protein
MATRNMRRSCFALLMELLRTQPEKAHLEHPEILINGWGLAVEAVYSGLGVVKEVYKSSRDFKNAEMSFHLTTKIWLVSMPSIFTIILGMGIRKLS